MTLDEFLKELSLLDVKWHIRSVRLGGRHIRDQNCLCPIISLAQYKGLNYRSNGTFGSAGRDLGLTYRDKRLIVQAADLGDLDVNVSENVLSLRKRLLEACKLEDITP